MITIEGLNFDPSPNFSVQLELYRVGENVLGGVYIYNISGTFYAEDSEEYDSMQVSILNKIGTCVALSQNTTGCSYDQEIVGEGTIGLVTDANVMPNGEILAFDFEMIVEVSKDGQKRFLIQPDNDLSYLELPDKIMFTSYSEQITTNYSGKIFLANNNKFINPLGSLTINVNMSVKNTDTCNSNNVAYSQEIKTFLNNRIPAIQSAILSNNLNYNIKIPVGATLVVSTSSISVGQFGGTASITLLVVPVGFNAKAVVNLTVSESTEQITKHRKATVRGNITGLNADNTFLSNGSQNMDNARSVLLILQQIDPETLQKVLDGDCGPTVPLETDSCYVLSKSSVTESTSNSAIDVELVYEDIEKCILKGYKISTTYEESPPIKKHVEHSIPNRIQPLVYYSTAESASRKKLTVKCSFNSCDESFLDIVKTAVDTQMITALGEFGLDQGNYIKIGETEREGKYSYAKTEEYLECDTTTG